MVPIITIRAFFHNDMHEGETMYPHSTVSRFLSTFKRFCNKEYGDNIWQYRSNDHIIRDRQDYIEHLKYIRNNPVRWQHDELFTDV